MQQLIKIRDKIQKKAGKYSACQKYLDKALEISEEVCVLHVVTFLCFLFLAFFILATSYKAIPFDLYKFIL